MSNQACKLWPACQAACGLARGLSTNEADLDCLLLPHAPVQSSKHASPSPTRLLITTLSRMCNLHRIHVTWARAYHVRLDLDGWSRPQVTSAGATSSALSPATTATGLMASFVVRLTSRGQLRRLSLHHPGMRPLIAICRRVQSENANAPLIARSHRPTAGHVPLQGYLFMMILCPNGHVDESLLQPTSIPWPRLHDPVSFALRARPLAMHPVHDLFTVNCTVLPDLCVLIHHSGRTGTLTKCRHTQEGRGAGSRPPNNVTCRALFPIRWRSTNLNSAAIMANFGSWPHVRPFFFPFLLWSCTKWERRQEPSGGWNCECHGILNSNHGQMLVRGE
ncbi:hypothetical protein IWX49DRAFT_273788 [Phyllosticta citricarpa]|uniref:Uncharacterized protein n=1 Tax=Phyllosticta paracitricarpa TaxID=2016321 RepID=A0ABR1N170_9PEZI